jgi:serine/threonine protein kinase/tetratricopeptide (TPR) repeat protein
LHNVSAPSELMGRLQAALGPQYRLERELGHGGMGVVYLARDTTLDRPVAVKVVHPDLAVHSSISERFLAEARMIAKLRHPNIVGVHTAGEATGLLFYVMDYVPGESLRHRLLRDGRLPIEEAQRIVADLADALNAAGEAGLVHRDVKPENILLDKASGRALLVDFGIARVMAGEPDGTRTAQGVAVGTPTYMSPEQAAGDAVDPRSDLYSLGVVAYEMIAGHPPFRGDSAASVASKHLAERAAPLERARADAPPALVRAVNRALEKEPGHRWQTGAEFRRAVLGDVATPASRRSLRRRIAVTGALALALILAAYFTLRAPGPPPGVNPRHSLLILPFDNVRQDPAVEWLRDGSVSMLALNLSQWTDLTVVDHERLHDLLERRHLTEPATIGLDMARQLARDAGVWTVVLGDYTKLGDSLQLVARVYDVATGSRVDVANVEGKPGDDVRPIFDQLAAQLLDLSGAPSGVATNLAGATTPSLEAYRAYLQGIESLNAWNLTEASRALQRAVALDSSFGLAYYKLSLARGWMAGPADSVGLEAIRQATRFADHLPPRERAMVGAYHQFLEGNFGASQAAYRTLLKRDSTDADAWYGLGDVTFHDPLTSREPERLTESLRAFKRAIALDPDYYLAYEHLAQIYLWGAMDAPRLVLTPNDSIVLIEDGAPHPGLDSARIATAVRHARADGITSARDWLTHQPDNIYAQNALILALSAAHQTAASLAEIDRLERTPAGQGRADLPFMRARVLAEQGEYWDAAKAVSRALDTARPDQFNADRLAYETIGDVSSSANLLGYLGKVDQASRTLELSAGISARWTPAMTGSRTVGGRTLYGHLLQSHLYTALGAPAAKLRPIWEAVADSARRTAKTGRPQIVAYGWAAALGLFLQNPQDVTPLNELQALGGGAPPPELKALTALEQGDSVAARRFLQAPDSATDKMYGEKRPQWSGYRQMIAAHAWHELGDEERALGALRMFDPARLSSANFDIRWLLVGQARFLRGQIYERQGKRDLARQQYELVLAQWQDADSVLDPVIGTIRARLSDLGRRG